MLSPTVVASPPTTTERPWSRASSDAAALAFRARVQVIDRVARSLISLSGMGIIAAVLGIGLFLFLEVLPLLRGARVEAGVPQPVLQTSEPSLLVIADEHQERAGVIGAQPLVRVVPLAASGAAQTIPLEGLEGQQITAAARVLREPTVGLGTAQGLVWIGTIALETVFEGERRVIRPLVERDMVIEAVPGRRITRLAYRSAESIGLIASIVEDRQVILTRVISRKPLIGPAHRSQESLPLEMEPSEGSPTALLINATCTQVLAGTSRGDVIRWRIPDEGPAERLEVRHVIPGGGVSAMVYVLGDRSIVLGGTDGSVATGPPVRDESMLDGRRLAKIHAFPRHQAAVTVINASPRDKGFLTASVDGTVRLQFMTSERTLAQMSLGAAPAAGDFAPKSNGALWIDAHGMLHHWRIDNPHPEISWRTLFGKIWYEGYERPDYVWQSTGGADDFESKFSLVPLIFGTLKGTCYALLFAVPLALFGALYCSQFLDKHLRNPIKSTIELMAALPSVVLGFVAGLVLAPVVQGRIVSVLILPVVIPAVAITGRWLTGWLPGATVKALVKRHEFWVLVAWVVVGLLAAFWAGPLVERLVFSGDFDAWLLKITGTRYDQRNSLVVGWAMGFAVIPIIFTICEDAFSSVPKHLVGASLACGASAWQTAWRVVLPAAGSGVFSAIMVGFGRAIGETMIVLMATGNTPVMDWSIFNGFRALSANIAVEIPEAPYGGTLYRVLFIAALLLFAITFIVNTIAELIRLRLRRQLQGI